MPIIQTTKELRERDVDDHYPTPLPFVRSTFDVIANTQPDGHLFNPQRIIDPGAGSGVYGTEARRRYPNAKIAGLETRDVPKPAAYDSWLNFSYVGFELPIAFDLVIGNPPYKFAEEAVRFGWFHLRPGGYMCFLLRLAFLEGQKRYRTLWQEMPPIHVAVSANRPSFTGDWFWFDTVTGKRVHDELQSEYEYGARDPSVTYTDEIVIQDLAGNVVDIVTFVTNPAVRRFVENGKTDATAYGFFLWQKPMPNTINFTQPTMSFVLSEDENEQ